MADLDKPSVHAVLKNLAIEGSPDEPFRVALSDGSRIEFPDPGEMGFEEAEEFLLDFRSARNSHILRKWLGEEQYERLKADKPTLKQIKAMNTGVLAHYSYIFGGSPGN